MRSILIVEDENDIREALGEFLESEGYQVHLTRNGQEALDALASGLKPAVILCDQTMPVLSGLELRKKLLSEPRWATTPFVLLTANNQPLRGVTVDVRLAKPIQLSLLLDTLNTLSNPVASGSRNA